ncbi:alpha/beta hydrolase family protein [Brevundimonas denitrificans]|uniref:alpha/beta hydrolase family protein n=1 Tax=Brevundimonas denitrificans TaxID=1443434 RepID=UPI00352FD16D
MWRSTAPWAAAALRRRSASRAGGACTCRARPDRRIPVMILQAERDDHIPSAGTRRWVDHLRNADVPVRLEVIRGARHIMNSDQWDDVFTRSSQFFARNIGRPPG